MDGREQKRWRRAVARRSAAKERRARTARAEQMQWEIDRQLQGWSRCRNAAYALIGTAVLIAAQHIVAHSGFRPIPLSIGRHALLAGYPMAGLLAIVGCVLLGGKSQKA